MRDEPAIKITWMDDPDRSIQVWADGRISGINYCTLINRIPILVSDAEERGREYGERLGRRWAFATCAAAFLILALMRWLGG